MKMGILATIGAIAIGLSVTQTALAKGKYSKLMNYTKVTPEIIQNFNSIEEALQAYSYSDTVSQRGNNSYFYFYEMPQYANTLLKHNNWRIPRRVLNLFCAQQGGTIREGNKHYFEPYVNFPDWEYKSQGTYACKVNNEFVWAVLANATQVQPDGTSSERYRYRFNLTVLPVEDYILRFLEPQTDEEKALKNKVDPTFAAKEKQRSDERLKELNASLAKWKEFDKKAVTNAPTKNDIGKTICIDSKYVESVPDKQLFDNVYMTNLVEARFGDIVAKLEDVSPNGKNIKINLRGIGDSSTGQIRVNGKWQYKGMEIKNGTVTWEPSYNWRVCSYV